MAQSRPFDDLRVYRDAEREGLRQQACLYFVWCGLEDGPIPDLTDAERAGRTKFAGIKLFADGSISGGTAWMNEPYRRCCGHGYSTLTNADLQAAYEWARRNRVQVAVHAMGDKALDRIVDFFAEKEPWIDGDAPSVRLEHASLLGEAQIRRMNESKMTFGVATQIVFFYAEHEAYAEKLTDDQYRRAYPVKTFYQTIERLALSSDAPATTWSDPDNVFVSIKAAVTRRAYNGAAIVPEEAITVPRAVLLYTARAATVAPFEGALGRISEGYEASFVVLDRDLFTVDEEAIDRTRVDETWIRGEKVYERRAR
jgi:predicted amidohydrolase YtcJ